MANIVKFYTIGAEYIQSVNTPEYSSDPSVVVNPDMSAVVNVPNIYWKRNGTAVVEMNASEKATVDAAILTAKQATANDLDVNDMKIVLTALIKVINLRLPAGNKITKDELVAALKAEM